MAQAFRLWYSLANIDYEHLTRRQRAKWLLEDPEAYINAVPLDQGYWWQVLDGLAKVDAYEPEGNLD